MPDEQTVVQETTTKQEAATEQPQDLSSRLQGLFYGDIPTNGQQKEEPPKEQIKLPEDEFETVDPSEWFKNEFKDYGFDDIEKAKEILNDWKKKADATPEEIKFANDQSKQVFELLKEGKEDDVIEIYNQRKAITKALSTEINKDNAGDVIKLKMQLTNKDLSPDEIEFEYKENYTSPKEPVQKVGEDDEDFKERHDQWKENVERIDMKRVIAAKMAKPELEKLKAELVLPELTQKENVPQPLSQEDLAKMEEYKNSFLKSATSIIKDFNGFSVMVKDKDVELPINYGLSDEEKSFIKGKMQKFAERNYDVNALFEDEWVNDDKTLNTKKMTEDLSRLYYGDKAFLKFATDGANKRLESYLKEKKNIRLDDDKQQGTFQPDNKTISEKMAEKFFA